MAQPNLQGLALPVFKPWGRRRHPASAAAAPWDDDVPPFVDDGDPPDDDGFEGIRKKLMAHLRHAAHNLNLTLPPPSTDPVHDQAPPPHPAATSIKRRRRSAKPPRPRERDPSPSRPPPAPATRSSRARSVAAFAAKQQRRRKFSVPLSRDEIDEDFYAFTGRRAPGRPRRRPPAIRKHLDLLFPGLGLSEVTAACYEVAPPRAGARGGG